LQSPKNEKGMSHEATGKPCGNSMFNGCRRFNVQGLSKNAGANRSTAVAGSTAVGGSKFKVQRFNVPPATRTFNQ
jgi:hypothetical protein